MKKPPLSAEDEALLAQMLANREKRRKFELERGPRPPLPPGGTFEKKWQEPFLAGAFPDEPRPPTPVFKIAASELTARGLPSIAVTLEAFTSALVQSALISTSALCSFRGPSIWLSAVVADAEESLEQTLVRCAIAVGDVARADTTRAIVAGVATEVTCFTWVRNEDPRAACVASIDVGGAPIVIAAECASALMARPTCAQVLAAGTLGDVLKALRLELVGT